MYELDSKVAIVTGAGGKAGIGRGIATRLAAEGARPRQLVRAGGALGGGRGRARPPAREGTRGRVLCDKINLICFGRALRRAGLVNEGL